MIQENMKLLNKICNDIDSGRKYVDIPKEKQYIRANTELKVIKCRCCGSEIIKNNTHQIVYYCGKCRVDRNVPEFRFVKEE